MHERNVAATICIEIQSRCTQVFMGDKIFIEINVSLGVKLYSHIQATNSHGYLGELCFQDFTCADIFL